MPYPVTDSIKQEAVKLTPDELVESYIIDLASVKGYVRFSSVPKKIIANDRDGLFPITRILVGDQIYISGSSSNNGLLTVAAITAREITTVETLIEEGTPALVTFTNYLYFVRYEKNVVGWKMINGAMVNTNQLYTASSIKREDVTLDLDGINKGSTMRVSVGNVDRVMESFIQNRAYLRGCNLYIVMAYAKHFPYGIDDEYIGSVPDYLSTIIEKFMVDGTSSNQEAVSFSCRSKFFFKEITLPGRIMDRDFCAWVKKYKGLECDPNNLINETAYPSCNGTITDCRDRGNSRRYGGFPGIPRSGIFI